jgi:hypothetical protein
MKLLLPIALALLFAQCGTKVQTVVFEYQRTPLNPIAYHQGITHFNVALESTLSQQYLTQLENYEEEVARLTRQHEELMNQYRQTSQAERVVRQSPEPTLVLPNPPKVPHTPNYQALANSINIAGMQRGEQNALFIKLTFTGFETNNHEFKRTTRKSKETGQVDSLLVSEIGVRNPVYLFIESPVDLSVLYQDVAPNTNRYTTIKGTASVDSLTTYSSMVANMDKEEVAIFEKNTRLINELLNSEFGTQYITGRGALHIQESDKNHDYSDLMQANSLAQTGLLQLKNNRNAAFASMNQALGIWIEAMKSYNTSKRSRINPDVMKGILKNAILICTFTDNWEFGETYINQLRAMKLNSKDRSHLNALVNQFNDLKQRYDALKK